MTSKHTRLQGIAAGPVYPAHSKSVVSKEEKSMVRTTSAPELTAHALANLAESAKTRMQEWLKKPQEHEQLAVGEDTSRAAQQTDAFFKDIEEKVKGGTM